MDVSFQHQALVDQLCRDAVISTESVELAFRTVPRHLFLPDVAPERVYSDEVIPTKFQDDRSISASSQPGVMATMLEQLELQPGHRVLEIGAGTGYNAALMAHLVGEQGQVTTIDIDDDLVVDARHHLAAAGFERVQVIQRDGWLGYAEAAPYDRIILTVAAWDIAPNWWEQLKPDGRLLLPLILGAGLQLLVAFERRADHLVSVSMKGGGFMSLRGTHAQPGTRLQLTADPDISLEFNRDAQPHVDEHSLYRLLTTEGHDRPTGLQATYREIGSSLVPWLVLHESSYLRLMANGASAFDNVVPHLYGIPGKFCLTFGLFKSDGLSVLVVPSEVSAPLQLPDLDTPLDLNIRSYGDDESLAETLHHQLVAWENAGRPTISQLTIKIYSLDTECEVTGDAVIGDRYHSRLVFDWQPSVVEE